MATRRYGTIIRHLDDDPQTAVELAAKLPDAVLHHLAEALRDEARRRAIAAGDHDALIAEAFEQGFGRDGLAVPPWIDGSVIVCPGGLVAKSRSNQCVRIRIFPSIDPAMGCRTLHTFPDARIGCHGTHKIPRRVTSG